MDRDSSNFTPRLSVVSFAFGWRDGHIPELESNFHVTFSKDFSLTENEKFALGLVEFHEIADHPVLDFSQTFIEY